jgi:hypothetical protein
LLLYITNSSFTQRNDEELLRNYTSFLIRLYAIAIATHSRLKTETVLNIKIHDNLLFNLQKLSQALDSQIINARELHLNLKENNVVFLFASRCLDLNKAVSNGK